MKKRKIIFRLLVLTLVLNFVNIKLNAQSNNLEFKTDGLYYAEFYDYIFRGHFEHINFSRKDSQFSMIIEDYLRKYGSQCSRYLPTNKVEIMKLVCSREKVTRNGYGIEISRVCVDWDWVGTGIFARPDLYKAKQIVQDDNTSEGIQKILALYKDSNVIGNSIDLIHKKNGLRNDMSEIFRLNSCNSKGIKRFEENLKRFALGKSSLRIKEESKYSLIKKSKGPKGEQNYLKLSNDLIANQSKTWMANRYRKNSTSNVVILSRDENGKPKSLKVNYVYSSMFGGPYKGWARISFLNGLPNCIYFHDFPRNCKKPNSSIIASFVQGSYSN